MKPVRPAIVLLVALSLHGLAVGGEANAPAAPSKDDTSTNAPANVQLVKGKENTTDLISRNLKSNVVFFGDLNEALKVVRVDDNSSKGAKLAFTVVLENVKTSFWSWLVGESPYWISYRTYWFIPAGVQENPPTGQILYKQIQPGETFSVTATAPNLDCKDFMLKVRQVDGPNMDPSDNASRDDSENDWGDELKSVDDLDDSADKTATGKADNTKDEKKKSSAAPQPLPEFKDGKQDAKASATKTNPASKNDDLYENEPAKTKN